MDWQNMEVPVADINRFLTHLCALATQHGATSTRLIVLLDANDARAVFDYFARLTQTTMPHVRAVSVEARLGKAMDTALMRMLLAEPQPGEMVVLASNDSIFEPECTQLAAQHHRMILMHTPLTKKKYVALPIWTATYEQRGSYASP